METPSWCVATGRCFWSCYPDFSRNFHMPQWQAMVIEGVLLLALVAIALCDVVRPYLLRVRDAAAQKERAERGERVMQFMLFFL